MSKFEYISIRGYYLEGEISTIEKRKNILKFIYDSVNGRVAKGFIPKHNIYPEIMESLGYNNWQELIDDFQYLIEEEYLTTNYDIKRQGTAFKNTKKRDGDSSKKR